MDELNFLDQDFSSDVISFKKAAVLQTSKMSKADDAAKTGMNGVDRYIKAFLPGSISVLGAETSTAKTTLCAQIAANIAAKQHKPVLFFSLESGYSITGIVSSYLSQKPIESLSHEEKIQDVPNLKIVAPDKQLSIKDIGRIASEHTAKLIIVDHIHYLLSNTDNLASSIGGAVRSLQMLARKLNTHIMIVSHLKKPDAGKENDIPSMYRLKDSSALYQDAGLVLLLSRKRKDPELMVEGESIFENSGLLVVAKNRDFGPTGIARFDYREDLHTFIF